MAIITQATREIAHFLVQAPTPEQIIALHPSAEVAARAYALIAAERNNTISDKERDELDSYELLEHFVRIMKAEARELLLQRAS